MFIINSDTNIFSILSYLVNAKSSSSLICLLGPPEMFLGSIGETPTQVLRKKPTNQLPYSHLLGHSSKCRQRWGPRPEDPTELGLGGR